VKIDLSNLRGTTRFNDLHEDLQAQITAIDTFITSQIAFREQCDALMPSHAQNLATVPADVDFVRGKLETTELALDNDSRAIESIKAVVKRDAENARLSFRAVENLKLPQQFHYQGMWGQTSSSPGRGDDTSSDSSQGPADLVSYVSGTADQFQATLAKYQRNIEEIEAHLRTLEVAVVQQGQQMMFKRGQDGAGRSRDEQVRELVATLTAFENGILGTARKVGEAREGVVGVVEGGAGGSEAVRGAFGRR
jgi:nucleoporin p58/p45